MESGQTASPSFTVGILLARELGVTPEYFAFGENGAPSPGSSKQHGLDGLASLARRVDAIEIELAKHRRRR
jgi:hypothetical protein